ncbi:hypothetical protein Xmau_03855 [Xenorhabdus mauleonii]|uniref:Exclusion-determining protein n=1 Tax=Xenorhabdus mauleonii TaxID=351675 RepID=A0A1I3V5S2_9GAMM|nr:hypothetical protein [Xenorhabdus mauleonii]PHM37637.1 hypothetical protein Xmau_03855 [Xenorhabdus mauleonii]SFJ90490.1 hypothetical protein SAMN05421680_11959 [Xenorhabdus mauleonii]
MAFINSIRKSYVPVVFVLHLIITPLCITIIGNYLFYMDFFSPTPYIALMVIFSFFLSKKLVFSKTTSKLNNLKKSFGDEIFSPIPELEYFDLANGKYIGIDNENGRILTISLYDRDKPILTGYDFYDCSGYDIKGYNLTLKFNNIFRPYFNLNINSNAEINSFCCRLDALFSPSFSPKIKTYNSFYEIVQKKTKFF